MAVALHPILVDLLIKATVMALAIIATGFLIMMCTVIGWDWKTR